MTKVFPFPFPERCRSLPEHNPAFAKSVFPWRKFGPACAVTPKTGGYTGILYGAQIRTGILACIPLIHVFGHFLQEVSR